MRSTARRGSVHAMNTTDTVSSTRVERFLAGVLAVFMLIGLLWLYSQPLDRTDDLQYGDETSSSMEYGHPEAGLAVGDVGPVQPGDRDLVRTRAKAQEAECLAEAAVEAATNQLVLAREAYRTRLDARQPSVEQQRAFASAEDRLRTTQTALTIARAARVKADRPGREAGQRLRREADDRHENRGSNTFLMRLALVVGVLLLSLIALNALGRRQSRLRLTAVSGVVASTAMAAVMTGDYIEIRELGPIVLSVVGMLATLAILVVYQRRLAVRLPIRRIGRGECPYCGYPTGGGAHCQGCGFVVTASCSSCAQPRRVGARHCAACGAA